MASVSTSAALGSSMAQKPSFAKIAAAGLKTPHAQQQASNVHLDNPKHESNPPQQDGAAQSSSYNRLAQTSPSAMLRELPAQKFSVGTNESEMLGKGKPEVQIQTVGAVPSQPGVTAPNGLLTPAATDDIGTQGSSSSGSMKPQSLDGKSNTSGATFGLDEKESLRPDDSASAKAIEDEETFLPPSSGLPGSHIGSDVGFRAFRDQLREISSMEPPRRDVQPPVYAAAPKGTLYVPPQGPGMGSIPAVSRFVPIPSQTIEILPDAKLLEALENPRDRVWVLKLEQDVIDFVKDASESSLNLPQCNSFYRMLAHKMADYYMLGHIVDDSSAVRLYKTPNCRIPPGLNGITTPSTAASTPPPSAPLMKILRRGEVRPGMSVNASENGESGNEDDKKPKALVSREEREARYEAARLRIMGSAKPSESPEAPKETQDSRSSSATGKKSKRKPRTDSDDDFEARSAYSNYFATTPFGPDGVTSTPYGYPDFTGSGAGQYGPGAYGQQPSNAGYHQQIQGLNSSSWGQQSFQQVEPTQVWAQGQPSPYDLSAEFQRSMSFQNQTPQQSQNMAFAQSYGQQHYGSQQAWPQQQCQMPTPTPQVNYGFGSNFMPTPNQMHDQYAYGQLPSQAFPGRLPNKLEHPLPGSYKSRHFNPQSQTFIPGHPNDNGLQAFVPSANPPTKSGFSTPYGSQVQRQNSSQSQASAYGSPLQNVSPGAGTSRPQSRQLTHPLPQRVLPRQNSPNLSLPPKPRPMPPKPAEQPPSAPSLAQQSPANGSKQSVIAMFGAPSSLPPKPPPSAEPFDPTKLPSLKRPAFAINPAMAARQPSGGYANFGGAMPQPSSGQVVNGTGGGKR